MKGSLIVGTDYAKYLCKKFHKPLIPVHHMIAHALTVRYFFALDKEITI